MSTMNRGTKRQAPTESSNQSETNENLSADDSISVPGTATYNEHLSQISGGKRRRKRFTAAERLRVAKVRKAGACKSCRRRKVKCIHALQGTDARPSSIPAPKPSPQPNNFDIEAKYLALAFPGEKYPGTIVEDDSEQWRQPDLAQFPDPQHDDGSHLINTIPALKTRQETLADELHDFENVFEENAGHGTVKNVPNTQKWGQDSPWMMAATADSQSSTTYPPSNTNFSIDLPPSSSTPASSHVDLLAPYIQDIPYCHCNEYGRCLLHRVTQDVHLSHYQEPQHVDVQPPTIVHHCPFSCGAKPFRKLEYLRSHITCAHPDLSLSSTQLSLSNFSEFGPQPDKLAYVQAHLHGKYVPGTENNPTATTDHGASGEIDRNLRRAHSTETHHGRVLREPRIRRSTSPMQTQPLARTIDDSAHKLSGKFSIASSNHGIRSTATNSNTSYQGQPLRGQHAMEQMMNFNVQHGIPQSYPQRTNSPTPSFIGQFGQHMQITDQSHLETYSEIGEEHGHSMFVAPNTALLTSSAAFAGNQSMMAFTQQTIIPYGNPEGTHPEIRLQPGYNGSGLGVSLWSGQGASTSAAQADVFNSGCTPSSFHSDNLVTNYPRNDGSTMNFAAESSIVKQPMLMLNDSPMNIDYPFASDPFDIEQVMSQRNSVPHLDFGTMSSSGTSESVHSLIDVHNPFPEKCGDDFETFGFNNMGESE